jgi:hypothetical protein
MRAIQLIVEKRVAMECFEPDGKAAELQHAQGYPAAISQGRLCGVADNQLDRQMPNGSSSVAPADLVQLHHVLEAKRN